MMIQPSTDLSSSTEASPTTTIEYGSNEMATAQQNPPTEPAEGLVKIPLTELSTTMKKYTHEVDGTTVTYIVVLGSDGEPRTAFDACEVCGGDLGYSQSGTDVICDKCRRFFRIDDLGSNNLGGGCWPAHIPHKVEDGYVIIEESDLDTGERFF
jgi:uncharacterized membrane protein